MKKWIVATTALAVMLSGCTTNKVSEPVEVHKGLTGVTILMGPDYMGTVDEALATGIETTDTHVTYKLSHANYREAMAAIEAQVQQSLTSIQLQYPAFTEILVNRSHTIVDVKVDFSQYDEGLETALLAVASSLMYYQLYDGHSQEDFDAVMNIYDAATNELIETYDLPEDLYK